MYPIAPFYLSWITFVVICSIFVIPKVFIYLFAPLLRILRESDFKSFRLENGLKIWGALWEHRHPDVAVFTTPVRPQRVVLRPKRVKQQQMQQQQQQLQQQLLQTTSAQQFGDVFLGGGGAGSSGSGGEGESPSLPGVRMTGGYGGSEGKFINSS